jgi:hypothetical protein
MIRLLLLLTFSLSLFAADKGNNLILGIPSKGGQIVNRVGYAFCYSEKHEQPLIPSRDTQHLNNFQSPYNVIKGQDLTKTLKSMGMKSEKNLIDANLEL